MQATLPMVLSVQGAVLHALTAAKARSQLVLSMMDVKCIACIPGMYLRFMPAYFCAPCSVRLLMVLTVCAKACLYKTAKLPSAQH
jgi:hypothetical protein